MNSPPFSLSPNQLEEIRLELMRALKKIERSMKITKKAVRPVQLDQTAVGRLSRIDAIQNQSMTQNLQERERSKYAQIIGAFSRIEDGTYGTCTGCGRPIGFQRLLVFPEAQTCAGCAA